MNVGIGEPYFDSIESKISSLVFSVPGVKGIEFGLGFGFSRYNGSEVNDPIILKDNKIKMASNNNGGINGGISNGEDIVFRCAIKPTPSIRKSQNTVDLKNNIPTILNIEGRHDPCIVDRARLAIEACASIARSTIHGSCLPSIFKIVGILFFKSTVF